MHVASLPVLRRLFSVLLAVILTSAFCYAADPQYAPGEVLVKFKEGTTDVDREEFEKKEHLKLIVIIKSIKVRLYRIPQGMSVEAAVSRFSADPIVKYAEPNHLHTQSAVNDPLYPTQWSLRNTGQDVQGTSGPAGIDIRWEEAMRLFSGRTLVTVAVVDSGVAFDHKELFEHTWLNEKEVDGVVGFDDDGNGYVDDAFGYDFFGLDANPLDELGHGTTVASIIAGRQNNGLLGVGVSPTVRIMALRNGGATPSSDAATTILAYEYAHANGARIVNCSFSSAGPNKSAFESLKTLGDSGILIVAAAGNGGRDHIGDNNDAFPQYPASYDVSNLIAVAAQDRDGGLARFSNFGATQVDIAAPGTRILVANLTRKFDYRFSFQSSSDGWTSGSGSQNASTFTWGINAERMLVDRISGAAYQANTDTWVKSPPLVGQFGPQLTFDLALSIEDDQFIVEASTDGIDWEAIHRESGSTQAFPSKLHGRTLDLSDYDGKQFYIRFRLVTNSSLNGGGVRIDNVEITSVTTFDKNVANFSYSSGTSLSAPMVAGVAALIMSQRPDLHASAVRTSILATARKLPALAGKVVTGGMLDAEAALKYAMALPSPPVITSQPTSKTVASGESVTFTAGSVSSVIRSYQWFKDGVPIPGATGATLSLSNVQASNAGSYFVEISNPGGPVRSSDATLTVLTGPKGWLSNLSVRTPLEANQPLIVGLVVKGGSKGLLIRAAGPALSAFGVPDVMLDPRMALYNGGVQVSSNDNWPSSLAATFQSVGAFGFPNGSLDSAVFRTMTGSETVHVLGGSPGVVLVEAYDTSSNGLVRLSNVSARNRVSAGAGVLIAGFAVSGTGSANLLIRGIGPTLASFGVTNALANPLIRVYDTAGRQVAINDNWTPQQASVFASTGAFALPAGSLDASLSVAVPPGSYTIHVSGTDGGTGEALVEIYEIP